MVEESRRTKKIKKFFDELYVENADQFLFKFDKKIARGSNWKRGDEPKGG
jgi:hypothetical protein